MEFLIEIANICYTPAGKRIPVKKQAHTSKKTHINTAEG